MPAVASVTAASSQGAMPPPVAQADLAASGMPAPPADTSHRLVAEAGTASVGAAATSPQVSVGVEAPMQVAASGPANAHQAATASVGPAAPNPVSQVVPAMLHVVSGESGSRMSLELNPHSLGAVVIAVERPSDGGVRVTLTAARPETLSLLQQDSSQLSHALDRAGVAAEGRSIVFHLAPAAPATGSGDSSGQVGAGAGGGGAANLAGQQGGQDPRRSGQSSSYAFGLPVPETAASPDEVQPRAVSAVQGIDITA
ncbi:MAG: flagellar hook-length control protein FliK [Acetobacteraceae bacterium]|nr:flagellar hook-length control protein FliK [Acetobacteraceae bacterium]